MCPPVSHGNHTAKNAPEPKRGILTAWVTEESRPVIGRVTSTKGPGDMLYEWHKHGIGTYGKLVTVCSTAPGVWEITK